ncbi:hypothetical protein [Embleya hyalina]|uniref:Uncharacterized protein n=1 Tax=Embleya hyalina TaxID=516124 RepID=A0A401Z2W9_9ACTN|nr:hypothetical protein [Embleya hyalina]GCE01245.1 hypothetical protein EHYA_09008 [Embleya hyalina]
MGSPGSEEQQLAAAMRGAATELIPPAGLVAGGITRGRRMRRARRMRIGASAVAVVALGGAAAVVLPGMDDGRSAIRATSGPAGGQSGAPGPSTSPPSDPAAVPPAGREAVSPQEIARILRQMPMGDNMRDATGAGIVPTAGEPTSVGAFAMVLVVSNKGAATLTVTVQASGRDAAGDDCAAVRKMYRLCDVFVESDGTHGYLAQTRPEGQTVDPGGKEPSAWAAQVIRRDGVRVSATSTSRVDAGTLGIPGYAIVSIKQLRDIVMSPSWSLWVEPEVNRAARAKMLDFREQIPTSLPRTPPNRDRPSSTALPPAPTGTPSQLPGAGWGSGGGGAGR